MVALSKPAPAASTTKTVKLVGETQTYAYVAVSPTGVRRKAKMIGPSPTAVSAALRAEGWTPLSVDVVKDGGVNTDLGDLFANRPLKLDHRELADFAAQLHQMIKAGVPVPRALLSLGEEAEPRRSAMCTDLAEKVSNGVPLSEAFGSYPRAFDQIFCAYISAGETSGTLPQTTARLADMLDKRSKLALKIKSVTAYPKLVSAAIALIVLAIMLFMVPMYADIYADFDAKLPRPTQILVDLSHQIFPIGLEFSSTFPFVSGVSFHPFSPILWGAIIYGGIKYYLHRTRDNSAVGVRVDKMRFKMPIFGALTRRQSLYRWTSTLSGGIESGVPLANSLDLAARTSGSRWQEAVVGDLKESVRSGKQLSEGLSEERDLFPPNLRAMVVTGESSGELATMLDSVASSIDAEIDSLIAGLSAKIEVALLLIMGIVVGALLAVLYLPILQLATTVGSGLSNGAF